MSWDYRETAFDEFSLHYADEERRAFQDEPAEQPQPRRRDPERHTLDEWREIRIQQGECPMPGCNGSIDADYNCPTCGCTSLPAQLQAEVARVTIPLPPHELPFDEYAQAQVFEDEAA